MRPRSSTREYRGRNTPGLWDAFTHVTLFLKPTEVPSAGVPRKQIPNLDKVQTGGGKQRRRMKLYS